MKQSTLRERGSSMIEMSLIIGLLIVVSASAIPNVRYNLECKLFVTQWAVADPVVTNSDGSSSLNIVIPRGCMIKYFNFDPGDDGLRYISTGANAKDAGKFIFETLSGTVVWSGQNSNGIFGELQR